MPTRVSLLLLLLSMLPPAAPLSAQEGVRTSRSSEQQLPLPAGEESFHFVVFGDRTGGPPEGIRVLAQAVKDANLLDPDLVMTVGDLIQGYNTQEPWMEQMREYRSTMQNLRMPWFPVPGNHDIYWRGENPPPGEHEANYEKHFGPLWYWFEHKKCGFLVLFSDEGDLAKPEKPRSFEDRAQQKFSDRQLEWVRQALQEMRDLRHVFVFMHHPRWAQEIYPGSNWDAVHRLMVESGNVRACFAGHTHRVRTHPARDGIEYYTLGATGAGIPGIFPNAGYLHHFDVVTVRPQGIQVCAVPVGSVIDPKLFTPERQIDLDRARQLPVETLSGPLALRADGLGSGLHEIRVSNPAQRPLDVTLSFEPTREWIFTPDHQHAVIEPGQERTFSFAWVRVKEGLEENTAGPTLLVDVEYLEENLRTPLPVRRISPALSLREAPAEAFAPATPNAALHLRGEKSGVRVDHASYHLPDGPLTLECWVRPEASQETSGLVAKTQGSAYGLLTEKGLPVFLVHLGGNYVSATAAESLPLQQWSHLAGVYDGAEVRLYVNGRRVAATPGQGPRRTNTLPLFIGADPDESASPTRSFRGWVDEVRLSRTARYREETFAPAQRLEPDEETVLLYHLDRTLGAFVPDHSSSGAHARLTGEAVLAPAPQ